MYIRFAVTQRDKDSGHPMGVFQAARDMRESTDTHPDLVEHLHQLREWFNENLASPWDDEGEPRAIFWFKYDASECIRRVWELVGILREGAYFVRQVTCTRPGKIVYEDEHQVGAIPFRETRSRL